LYETVEAESGVFLLNPAFFCSTQRDMQHSKFYSGSWSRYSNYGFSAKQGCCASTKGNCTTSWRRERHTC
jgi:hypothetical protein